VKAGSRSSNTEATGAAMMSSGFMVTGVVVGLVAMAFRKERARSDYQEIQGENMAAVWRWVLRASS
jgi:hypothetical protein